MQGQWAQKYHVYPQLPLAKLLSNPPADATPAERSFFYKANVDYTLCDLEDHPIVSIEFDGAGGGFSREGKYLHGEELSYETKRRGKLEFKLALARENGYPLYVVSYQETGAIEKGETLTILDGIIARVLYKMRENELIRKYAAHDEELLASMENAESNEHLQDLVLQAGVAAEIETDMFDSDRVKYVLQRMGLIGQAQVIHYEHPPAVPKTMDDRGIWDYTAILTRSEALDKAVTRGTRIILDVKSGPTVMRDIRMRALGDWFTAHQLSAKIATYLALKQAASLVPTERRAEFEALMRPNIPQE